MRRSTASFILLVIAAATVVAPACAPEPPIERLVIQADEPSRPRAVLDASPVLAPEPRDIAGTIASDLRGRAAGRDIVIVDANGERRKVVTGDGGTFSVEGVLPPYDLAVLPIGEGPVVSFLGLQRSDPFLALFERDDLDEPRAEQTLRVSLRLGRSPCANTKGWITVVTTSDWGGGTAVVPCAAGARSAVVDVEHVAEDAIGPGGVTVHVLVEDDAGTAFAYARSDLAPSDAAAVTESGGIEPVPVALRPSVTIEATGETSLLPDWHWMTAASLDVGGRTLFFAVAEGTTAHVSLPAVPGAAMSASVMGWHPKSDGRTPFYRSIEAWSGTRPLSTKPLQLSIAAGPEILRPAEAEAVTARNLTLEWVEATTARSTAFLSVRSASGRVFEVVTDAHAVPAQRLDALGVHPLDVGDYALELAAFPSLGVDDVTSPVRAIRSRRLDRSRSGAATLVRLPFVVVE